MSEFAANVVGGIAIAAVASWITVQLTVRRFRAERWWEKKVEAYERVIEALHHSKAFTNAHMEANMAGQEISEEHDKELRSTAKKGRMEIERALDIGSFALGKKAQDRLRKYIRDVQVAEQTTSWIEYLDGDLAATNECLKDIIRLAKQDLR